ncbi:MAG TPA: acetate uptake transporter [bacterium]|nr:acetate uptake transporter [bacterium]
MAEKPANPAPLGLAGFGLTTVVLSLVNVGWIPVSAESAVVPLAFAYGGLAQIIAGILEYSNGNTFGLTAFTSYGLFWLWFAFLNWTAKAGLITPPTSTGVGVTLLMWGVFTLYMWVATFRSNRGVWSVFLLLWITFFLLAIGALGGGASWRQLGGLVGLITGLDALYVSFAEVTNAAHGRTVVSFLMKPVSKK